MAREVHPQQPDERATAFFRALDQYNRALEEDLEVAAVRVENDSGLRPARADRRRQSSRSIPKPDDQGTAVSQGGNDVNEEDLGLKPGSEAMTEALNRAKSARQKLVYELEECKVACLSLKQDISAERSRAAALRKTIKNVRTELRKALDQRGWLLDRKHRIAEECRDLERQVGEMVGRRGALMAELGRDREDVRLLKQALATAKAEKIELGRLVSAAKTEARRWANGIIHQVKEAQSDSEIRLTDMAVGGLTARVGEGEAEDNPPPEATRGVWSAQEHWRQEERERIPHKSEDIIRREQPSTRPLVKPWANTAMPTSSSSSSSCITIPMSFEGVVPLKKVLDTFSLFYGMIGPGGSAPSSSSSSALQPPGDPINGGNSDGRAAVGRRLKSLCPHILPDIEFPSETCVRVGRGPPKRGDNVKVVNINVPQVSKFHFELSLGAPLPGQSVAGWIVSNRSRGGTYVGRTLQTCRKVGRSGVSCIADSEMIFLFPPNRGPILGYQLILGDASAPSTQPARQPTTPQLSGQKRRRDSSSSELPGEEEIAEELRCAICQDLMYRPVMVLDCLHNFCSSCLSQWLQRHTDCPQCRSRVRSVKPNRTVVNLTEKLVEGDKIRDRRSDQDKRQSDDSDTLLKNDYDLSKVNRGFLLAAHGSATSAGTVGRSDISYTDYDSYDEYEDEYSSPDDDVGLGLAMAFGMFQQVPCSVCGYCHSFDPVPGSRCVRNALHVSCNTCQNVVPDRPDLHVRCAICTKAFCTPATTRPCLAAARRALVEPLPSSPARLWNSDPNLRKLKDLDTSGGYVTLFRALGDNSFEATALEEHLRGVHKHIGDVTREVLGRDQNAKFKFEVDGAAKEIQVRNFYNDHYVCSKCGYEAVKQCIFQYRKALSDDQLPQRCRGRENCWYGMACRTQKHNMNHAARLNHICDRTRF